MTFLDPRAFFAPDGNGFVASDNARGPWSADACHGGPVAGLMARAAEKAAPDKQLARLTITFHRPVPMRAIRVEATPEREGRSTATTFVTLTDDSGRLCAGATTMHLATTRFVPPRTAREPALDFASAQPGNFPVGRAAHPEPFITGGIEVRYPPGETADPGPTTLWMRTVPIVAGETSSPFQRLCPLADCGNGISRNAEITEASCINPDLTIVVYRLPRSDWLASRARSFWEPTGIGMSHATLYDTDGSIGTALQTIVVRPVVS